MFEVQLRFSRLFYPSHGYEEDVTREAFRRRFAKIAAALRSRLVLLDRDESKANPIVVVAGLVPAIDVFGEADLRKICVWQITPQHARRIVLRFCFSAKNP